MKRKFKHGDRVMQTYPQPEPGTVVEVAGQLFFKSALDGFTVLIGNDDYYKLVSKDAANVRADFQDS